MATFTATDVNLHIISAVGFRRPAYAVSAPRPLMTTTYTLNGITQSDVIDFGATRIVSLSTVTDFYLFPGSTSTAQTIGITNFGNSTLTLVAPYFRWSSNGVQPVVDIAPSSILSGTPKIPPGMTGTFTLAYYGEQSGEYSNWFIIVSDSDAPQYKFITKQIVQDDFGVTITPTYFTTATTTVNERARVTYVLTPIYNQVEDTTLALDANYYVEGSPAWSIVNTGTNEVTLEFESGTINNTTGTYSAQLHIETNFGNYSVPNSASVDIDYTKNYNIKSWQSPIAHKNSIIGVSYDVIAGKKYLTIGVGAGGDGSPQYDDGGDLFISMRSLGIEGAGLDNPYPFWAEVYRFYIPSNGPATYLSGSKDADGFNEYQVKFTEGLNYGHYFGYETSYESMFIVKDDGFGNLRITINGLREYSGNADFDKTLDNLTRAFHYYSEKDSGGRIQNLVQYPFQSQPPVVANTSTTPLPLGEERTSFFLGFDVLSTTTSSIVTSIVPIPR